MALIVTSCNITPSFSLNKKTLILGVETLQGKINVFSFSACAVKVKPEWSKYGGELPDIKVQFVENLQTNIFVSIYDLCTFPIDVNIFSYSRIFRTHATIIPSNFVPIPE